MSQPLASRQQHTAESVGLPISWYFDPDILEIARNEAAAFVAHPPQEAFRSPALPTPHPRHSSYR